MKIVIKLNDTLCNKGKTKYWLAKETGMTPAGVNNLCNNKTSQISFKTLLLICEALDCKVSDIIDVEK